MKDDGTTREDLTITEFCNPPTKEAAKAMLDKLDGEQAVLVCVSVLRAFAFSLFAVIFACGS
jgi:hypothetical protein